MRRTLELDDAGLSRENRSKTMSNWTKNEERRLGISIVPR